MQTGFRAATAVSRAPATAPLRGRDLSLEAVRAAAVVMVVLAHVAAFGFGEGPRWAAVNAFGSISRSGVPIFFMVTGSVLLGRDHTPWSLLRRIWKVTLPLFLWSLIYLAWAEHEGTRTEGWIATIFRQPVAPHLWFLYNLIGAYPFIPLLDAFFRYGSGPNLAFAVAAWFFGTSLIVFLSHLHGIALLGVFFTFLPIYAGYILVGGLMTRHIPRSGPATVAGLALWVGATTATGVVTNYWSTITGVRNVLFYEYWSPTVLLAAVGGFVAIRNLSGPMLVRSALLRRCATGLARASFGIYLLHFLVLYWLQKAGVTYAAGNSWVWLPLTCLLATALSYAIIRVLQINPMVRVALCP